MTAKNFMETVDKLGSNDAYSLDLQEKQALNSVGRAALRGNEKGWVDYFKNKTVKIGDKKVSVDAIARGLEIKQNPKNPNKPIVTYGGSKVERGSELAALIQVHAMTTSKAGLNRFRIDGKIGNETATALRGKNSKGEYNSKVVGVKNIRESQEKLVNNKNYKEVKRGIDMFGKKIKKTIDPILNEWMIDKHNGKNITCQESQKGSGYVEIHFYGKGGLNGKWQDLYRKKDIESKKFLDDSGKFNEGKFLFAIMEAYHGVAFKEYENRIKKEIRKIDGDINKYKSSAKDNALFDYGIDRCNLILTGISEYKSSAPYAKGYIYQNAFNNLEAEIKRYKSKYESLKK